MSPNTCSAVSSRFSFKAFLATVGLFAFLAFAPAISAQVSTAIPTLSLAAVKLPATLANSPDANYAHPVARLISSTEHVDMPRPFRPRVVLIDVIRPAGAVDTAHAAAPMPVPAAGASAQEQRVLQLINEQRTSMGLKPLTWDPILSQAARMHSANMASRGFFNHVAPDGSTASSRIKQCGMHGWSALGENIAFNQGFDDPVAFAVEQWLKSPMHRQNMLSPMWSSSAVGIATAPDGRVFFTELFLAR